MIVRWMGTVFGRHDSPFRPPTHRSGRRSPALGAGLAACVVSLVLAAGALAAASEDSPASCAQAGYRLHDDAPVGNLDNRPPNPDGPTQVAIGYKVLALREIQPVSESFDFRGYLHTTWCDPRLAFEPGPQGDEEKVYVGPAVARRLSEIWYPQAFTVNQIDEIRISERILRIRSDGTVLQDINLSVSLSSGFDLRHFPFDVQRLQVWVESFTFSEDQVEVVVDAERSGFAPGLELAEWDLVRASSRVESAAAMRSDRPFSRLVIEMELARKRGFYLWKVFLPLIIIVALSWSVFWMSDESFASRSRVSATGVLTIVAYQFVFAAGLPRIGYLTMLDRVMIVSFGLLAVTVLQSLLVAYVFPSNEQRARNIDRASRLAFPLTYGATLGWIFTSV